MLAGFHRVGGQRRRAYFPAEMSLYSDGRGPTAAGEGRGLLFHIVRGLPVTNRSLDAFVRVALVVPHRAKPARGRLGRRGPFAAHAKHVPWRRRCPPVQRRRARKVRGLDAADQAAPQGKIGVMLVPGCWGS